MSKFYSAFLKTIIMPIADKAMNTSIMRFYHELNAMHLWAKQDIEEWQNNQLQKLIQHAYANTKYYNRLLNDLKIDPQKIISKEDLIKIPPLTKKDIRDNFEDLIPNNINSIPYKKSSTGGSSGDPLVYYLDKQSWSFAVANNIYNWEKTGYKYGDKYIALGSTSLFIDKKVSLSHKIYYSLKNKIGLNGMNMSDNTCDIYVRLIKKKKIKYVYGYASAIYLLARYVIKNKIKLNIIACFPTSEVLSDLYRRTIIKAFNCQVLNVYGANDGGITAFEQTEGFFEVGYNTIIKLEKTNTASSKIFLTDMLNYSMPLINYEIGDEVVMNENKKGVFNGQTINKVLGRSSDVIELENGNVLTGPGFTILFKDLPVEYYYIEKKGKNSILCTIKKLPEYNKNHEEIITSTFQKQMGDNSSIELNYSNIVKYTKSGKQKYFN
jgi:phenylacetate-CoA ligase